MAKKRKFLKLKRPTVFVPMCLDFLHHGHINILTKSRKYGTVIVGLMTDKAILSYKKRNTLIKFNQRKKIAESIKFVSKVIPLNGPQYYSSTAKKYKFDYFVHGTDWKKGPQSKSRKELLKTMQNWNGKIIEIKYTKNISSSKIKKVL